MRTNTGLWWLLSGFFLLMAVVYTTWAIVQSPDQAWHTGLEPVGTVALLFTAIMGALIAFYVGRVHSAQGGELPEDVLTADIDDGDPELGEFSPWSWWPIVLAFSAALGMLGSRGGQLAAADRHRCVRSWRSSAGSTSTIADTSRAESRGPMPIRLRAAGVSDVGAFRDVNQDAAFTAPWGAAVADGVGGGPSGDLASAALVHRLVAGRVSVADAEALAVRIREANWDLRAHVQRDEALRGMATTFTGLFVSQTGRLLLAHTGDSRAYMLRGGVLTRETRDDSFVQTLVDHGLIAAEAAASHPRRNIITASLAGSEDDAAHVVDREPRPGDRWLLCSDGVTDYLSDDELMRALAAAPSPEAASASLVAAALEAGTRDNVTAVVCDVEHAPDASSDDRPTFYGAAADRFCEELDSA